MSCLYLLISVWSDCRCVNTGGEIILVCAMTTPWRGFHVYLDGSILEETSNWDIDCKTNIWDSFLHLKLIWTAD